MSLSPERAAARGRPLSRRTAARARRRRQRQDARDHGEDRAPGRAGHRLPARIAAITFTNKAAREMRERAAKLLAAQGTRRRGARGRDLHVPCARACRSCAPRRGGSACKPGFSILDPADLETLVAELVGTARPRPCARGAVEDQRLEERAGDAGRRAGDGRATTTSSPRRARTRATTRRSRRSRPSTSTT